MPVPYINVFRSSKYETSLMQNKLIIFLRPYELKFLEQVNKLIKKIQGKYKENNRKLVFSIDHKCGHNTKLDPSLKTP